MSRQTYEGIPCPKCGLDLDLRRGRFGLFLGCPRYPNCSGSANIDPETGQVVLAPPQRMKKDTATRGTRRVTSNGGRTSILPGDFLTSTENDLGPGKAIEPGPDDTIVLEYFDNPGQAAEDRHRENVLRRNLRRYSIPSETRVFWEEADAVPSWRSGRVQSVADDEQIEVKGYGDDYRFHDQKNLYIRWNRPLEDPSGFSRVGLFDSPHNSERRAPVLRSISEQRAAARGMTGLLSTAVELHDHQLIAARRVLEDHTQRYLLADEVGLGKTIEALLIMRQLLIDDGGLHAVVIAPPHLTGQWQDEIDSKLFPEQFPLATIDIYSYDEGPAWTSGDLLVIDEAHNIVTGPHEQRVRELADESPRVLLLSATPALHNERHFLAMLRVLDPDVYCSLSVEDLVSRLQARQDLGRALVGLRPDAPEFVLSGAFTALKKVLQGEGELLGRLSEIQLASDDTRAAAIRTFRGLVADAFQVHRRMIRSRRTERLAEVFPVAGRSGKVGRLVLDSDVWTEIAQPLEHARELVAIALEKGELTEEVAGGLLTGIVSAAPDPAAMREAAAGTVAADAFTDESCDAFVTELVDALTGEVAAGESIVIFAPTTGMAQAIARELEELFDGHGGSVTTLIEGLDGDIVRSRIAAFSEPRKSPSATGLETRWIVCDRSAEEGANLQAADLLVHVGLPAKVNELEQRIGRVDRWSTRSTPWRALEVVPDDGLLSRWASVVRDGFQVHEYSLASLQRAAEEVSNLAMRRLLDPGRNLPEICQEISAGLELEREAVREQDAVDALTLGEHDLEFSARLREVDQRADTEFPPAFQALMSDAYGNLRFRRSGDLTDGVASFSADDPARRGRHAPLVPLRRVATDFMASLDIPHAGPRAVAVRERVAPVRTGTQLVDAVESFLRHDDRGRCWGIWRWDSAHERATEVWWRVDLLVRAVAPNLPERADPAVVQRRLDTAMPPHVETVWIANGEVQQPDAAALSRLTAAYDTRLSDEPLRRDFNLSPKRAHALLDQTDRPLPDITSEVVEAALAHVATIPELVSQMAAGQEQLTLESERRAAALHRRQTSLASEEGAIESELALERRLLELMTAAVAEPSVGMDALGVIVLSGKNPFEQPDE